MTPAAQHPTSLAVDIGGTKIALGVFDVTGRQFGETHNFPVPFLGNDRADLAGLVEIIRAAADNARCLGLNPCAIGLSICGNVDMRDGTCLLIPNLRWRGVPFGRMVQAAANLPVFAATDTRQAALAEHTRGAARDARNFCWVTLGTGYGGYLFLDGKLFDGHHGIAGPFGHNTIDEVNGYLCGCGRRGCVETYVAGPAIARAGQAAREAGESALLAELAGAAKVSTPMVIRAFHQGDPTAIRIIGEVARIISISLAGVNNLLDLEMFILGGGIVRALPELVDLVDRKMRGYLMSEEAKRDLQIKRESFPNASLIGAAMHAFVNQGMLV